MRDDFASAGVALLFLKGLTVGKLAYGNAMLKMGWDIDLLVDPDQLVEAAGLLEARGYRQISRPRRATWRLAWPARGRCGAAKAISTLSCSRALPTMKQ